MPVAGDVAARHYRGEERRDPIDGRMQATHGGCIAEPDAAFQALAGDLEAEGVRPDDVHVVITDNHVGDRYPGARGTKG